MCWTQRLNFILTVMVAVILILAPDLRAQNLEELHKSALEGSVELLRHTCPDQCRKILPAFEKRFPGLRLIMLMRHPINSSPEPSPRPAAARLW